ncbi:MAG TPA: prepilin-type N-terminal cleavage/methylation domain-containing protein [Burkholderiaceae bacterium]
MLDHAQGGLVLKPGPSRASGFTLIELMITIALLALLMMLAVPAFNRWISDAKVRAAAESLQNALRQAQSTAIARNRATVFVLTSATPALNATPSANASNWYAQVLPLSGSDESSTAAANYVQGSNIATQNGVTITGPALVCFCALGKQLTSAASATGNLSTACTAPSDDAGTPSTSYTLSRTSAQRTLKVLVYLGGRVRMCDAAKTLSNDNPDGCPSS